MSLKKSFIKSRNSFKVTFKVPDQVNPEGKDIRVLGEFNNWKWEDAPSLKPSKDTFKVDVELKAGQNYQYRFFVDQSYWVNDASADAYAASPYGDADNCVVVLDKPVATVKKSVSKKPAAPAVADSKVKVNFSKIEGIGPKIAELLTNAGLKTYDDLAKAKKKELTDILAAAGKRYQLHDPSTWAKQSKLLAQGKIDELKKLQSELKGGRKV